jgi:hypothetical protein
VPELRLSHTWKHPGIRAERKRYRETEDEFEPGADGLRRARYGRHDGERQELKQKARQHRVIAADRILVAEGLNRQAHRARRFSKDGLPSAGRDGAVEQPEEARIVDQGLDGRFLAEKIGGRR